MYPFVFYLVQLEERWLIKALLKCRRTVYSSEFFYTFMEWGKGNLSLRGEFFASFSFSVFLLIYKFIHSSYIVCNCKCCCIAIVFYLFCVFYHSYVVDIKSGFNKGNEIAPKYKKWHSFNQIEIYIFQVNSTYFVEILELI